MKYLKRYNEDLMGVKLTRDEIEDNFLKLRENLGCHVIFNSDIESRWNRVCLLVIIPKNIEKDKFLKEYCTILDRMKRLFSGHEIDVDSREGFRWLFKVDKSLDKETQIKYFELFFKFNPYMKSDSFLKKSPDDNYNYLFNYYGLMEGGGDEWFINGKNIGKICDMIEFRIDK